MSRRLRIAYFAEIFPSKSETWVHHEIIELKKLGHIVHVFATRQRPKFIPEELKSFEDITTYLPEVHKKISLEKIRLVNMNVLILVIKGWLLDTRGLRAKVQVIRDFIYTLYLFNYVESFMPEIIYTHFAATRANLGLFYSLFTGTPFTLKMHAEDVFRRQALIKLKVKKCFFVSTISEYNIRFIRDNYSDIETNKFVKHSCGLPLHQYKFTPRKRCEGIAIIAIGRLVRMKGFDILLYASRILNRKKIPHRIVLIGEGPERKNLERLVEKLALSDTVTLSGYRNPDEVKEHLRTSDLFVLPSLYDKKERTQDGIPVAIMEAMAMGVPVVSSRISGIPELIQADNGFLVEPNNPEDLARGIEKYYQLPTDALEALLFSARKKIESDYDVSKLTSYLSELFMSISQGGRNI